MSADNQCSRRLLNLAKTADKVGSSTATIRRWSQNPVTGFPEPVNIHNKLFWFEDEVLAWIEFAPAGERKASGASRQCQAHLRSHYLIGGRMKCATQKSLARSLLGGREPSRKALGNVERSSSKPSKTERQAQLSPEQQKLLAKWQAAKDRCEVNRQLTDWIIDFTARRKRAEVAFLYHDCSVDHRDLQAEWERFKLCMRLARERRP